MAKKKQDGRGTGGGIEGPAVFNNFSDLAQLKENMPDATGPLKKALEDCFVNGEATIKGIFEEYPDFHPTAQDRTKLVSLYDSKKEELVSGMVDFFVQKFGLAEMVSMLKEKGDPIEFIRDHQSTVVALGDRMIMNQYKEILEGKKAKGRLAKGQEKDIEEVGKLLSEELNISAEESKKDLSDPKTAPGTGPNPTEIISDQAELSDQERSRERFKRVLREFSEKYGEERVAAVERMRKLKGEHAGLPFDIGAIKKQVEEMEKKFQDPAEIDRVMKEIGEKWGVGNKKKEPLTSGFVANHISSLIKNGLGENEKTFIEDGKELEIAERKTRRIISDYTFGKNDELVDTRIEAAVETIREAGVRLKLSPDKLKEKYIEAKRSILKGLVSKVIASDDRFREILAMKKGEDLPNSDLKKLIMKEVRQMIVQAFERREKPKAAPAVAEPPENIPLAPEADIDERSLDSAMDGVHAIVLSELEKEKEEKFMKGEKNFLDEHLNMYERRLQRHIKKENFGTEEVEKFKKTFIESTLAWAQRRGMKKENVELLEKYLSLRLPISVEKEESEEKRPESKAPAKEKKGGPEIKIETEKEEKIWEIISDEIDWMADGVPESEYTHYFQQKFDKDKADYRRQGLSWEDADFIAKVFRSERDQIKERVWFVVDEEMKRNGKTIRQATLREIRELARKGVRKEVDEYFQKAVRGELGSKEEKEMETEVKFSKEETEILDSLSEVAQEVWEEELEESKSWGGKWTKDRVFEYFKPVLEANMEEILEGRGFNGPKRRAGLGRILSKVK